MASSKDNQNGAGSILLSAYIDRHRQPTFLHRNLEQALSYHQALLEGQLDARWITRTAADNSRFPWTIPSSMATLNKLADQRRPELRLDLESIVALASDTTNADRPARKRAKFMPIDCTFSIIIYPDGTNSAETAYVRDRRAAQLLFHDRVDSAPAYFSVKMEPLLYSVDKFQAPFRSRRKWMWAIPDNLAVQISCHFQTSHDAALFVSLSSRLDGGRLTSEDADAGLWTVWRTLHVCPPPDHVLAFDIGRNSHGHLSHVPSPGRQSMGLKVSMGFRSGTGSPLETFSRAVRQDHNTVRDGRFASNRRGRGAREVLNEIAINGTGSRTPARQVKIGYMCPPQGELLIVEGYCCAICKDRRFPSREQLLHHIKTTYHFLEVRVRTKLQRAEAKLKLDCIIEFETKKNLAEGRSSSATIGKDIAFVAPTQPFDIVKHLSGADGWSKSPHSERHTSKRASSTRAPRAAHDKPNGRVRKTDPTTQIRSRAIADTPDLPVAPRITRPVPRIAKGKLLFRASSKRALIPGEEVSESDDDIDTSWFKKRRDLLVAASDLTDSQKKFAILWNDYFEDHERLSGDVYMGEATVRFMRARADVIVEEHLEPELEARLIPLVETRVIREEARQYCRELLAQVKDAVRNNTLTTTNGSQSRSSQTRDGLRVFEDGTAGRDRPASRRSTRDSRSRTKSSDAMDIDTPSQSTASPRPTGADASPAAAAAGPAPSKPAGPTVFSCLCGKSADSFRTAIHCSKLDCWQPLYHMSCVGMTTKDPNWLCHVCRPASPATGGESLGERDGGQ